MVWFQCEDCGENLKKPKLPTHFRICSATKLSCIDCGEIFGQESVQRHTQCITEAEKYGPKGQVKVAHAKAAKPANDKQKPDFDINVGLSQRPPWFCSLCNTQATSKQALLLHAEGKKHRAKARAFHAANQTKPAESIDSAPKVDGQHFGDRKENGETENGNSLVKRKRNSDASEDDGGAEGAASGTVVATNNGDVVQAQVVEGKAMKKKKKSQHNNQEENEGIKDTEHESAKICDGVESGATKGDSRPKLKMKKLITSTLRSIPDGVLKMRKLHELVLKALQESGISLEEDEFKTKLEQKVSKSSKFIVDGKYVRLVNKQ